MRRPSPLALAALLAGALGARSAHAQFDRATRAFEPAIVPFVGFAGFGDRLDDAERSHFQYNASLAIGAQLQHPLTRRTALLGTLALAPLSHVIENRADHSVVSHQRVMLSTLDVGFAGRLKPAVPVFGYLGAGAVAATRPPEPDVDGVQVEPRVSVGAGVDLMRGSSGGLRVAYTAHFAVPRSPDPTYGTLSHAYDWTLLVGGRITLGRSTR
jgi:hypothetical protein